MKPAPRFAETWLENWPPRLAALSFPHAGVPLGSADVLALGRANGVHTHLFAETAAATLTDLRRRLDALLAGFPGGAFIRLGSRSAKDTALGVLTGCHAACGTTALALLTSGSRRVAFDLRCALQAGYTPWVFAREWRDLASGVEFRCFARDGRLVGVSQYHRGDFSGAEPPDAGLAGRLVAFHRQVRAACGLDTVVYDVVAAPDALMLIELNPFDRVTDPCLFSWSEDDFRGDLRWREAGARVTRPLPTEGSHADRT